MIEPKIAQARIRPTEGDTSMQYQAILVWGDLPQAVSHRVQFTVQRPDSGDPAFNAKDLPGDATHHSTKDHHVPLRDGDVVIAEHSYTDAIGQVHTSKPAEITISSDPLEPKLAQADYDA